MLNSFGYKKHEMSLYKLLYLKGQICWCIVNWLFNSIPIMALKPYLKPLNVIWKARTVQSTSVNLLLIQQKTLLMFFFLPFELPSECDLNLGENLGICFEKSWVNSINIIYINNRVIQQLKKILLIVTRSENKTNIMSSDLWILAEFIYKTGLWKKCHFLFC